MRDRPRHPDTLLAQAGHEIDAPTGAVVPPLHTSTTFARDEAGELPAGFRYARYGNPTVAAAERVLCELEGGSAALLFGSGLAAASTLLETLRPGERLVAPTVMYHGGSSWMRRLAATRGIELVQFDATRSGALESAVGESAALVWIESLANPTWDVVDIERAAAAAHAGGAELVVDSTVAPPVTTRPLSLGADLVVHSTTKYLNGHSDALGGALVARWPSARWDELCSVRDWNGSILAPFNAWLLLRGLRTLAVRFERSSTTALRLALHFEGHPGLRTVLYPGLANHPGHAVAARQMTRGFGGMLSLRVRGDFASAQAVVRRLRVFLRATSLGGVESLVEHRAAIEGSESLVPPDLLRCSIGLEHPDDLIADLEQALEAL